MGLQAFLLACSCARPFTISHLHATLVKTVTQASPPRSLSSQPERVLSEKQAVVAVEEDRGPGLRPGTREEEVTKYLVKWEGLPYAECTWEAKDDVIKAGGWMQLHVERVHSRLVVEIRRPGLAPSPAATVTILNR